MSYRVEYSEIDALSTEIETRCDDMLERLEDIKTAVNGLIDNPDLQGQYAIALKSYLAPTTGVYGTIINAFKDIITVHRDNFMLYKAQYMNVIDTGIDAVIPEDELFDTKDQLLSYTASASASIDAIVNALNSVSDIYSHASISEISNLSFYASYDANTISNTIDTLDETILTFENAHSQDDFICTGEALQNLKTYIQSKLQNDSSYAQNYSTVWNINELEYRNLTSSISALSDIQEDNSEIIAAANQYDDDRDAYFVRVEEAEQARIITTVAVIGISIGSVAIIVASGGTATPLVVAGISAGCGALSAGVNEGIDQYVVTGDIMPTDWGTVGLRSLEGGAVGFATGYIGAAGAQVITTAVSNTAANALINSSNTFTRVVSNTIVGSVTETTTGIATRSVATVLTSDATNLDDLLSDVRSQAFDPGSMLFDASLGGFSAGISSINERPLGLQMSREDARRYEIWTNLRESGLNQEQINNIILTNRGLRPNPSTYLDSRYINSHLSQFDDGISIIQTEYDYSRYSQVMGFVGRIEDNSLFVLPRSLCDEIISESNGDLSIIERELGFPAGHFSRGGGLVRIDVRDTSGLNLRMPSGNEAGANELWTPGGFTSGGVPEAITDIIPLERTVQYRIAIE